MTPSELKYHVENRGTESHYFDRKSMKFFGDTMANFGVRSVVVATNYDASGNWVGADGVKVEAWELYRKKAVKHGLKGSVFFAKNTFERAYKSA